MKLKFDSKFLEAGKVYLPKHSGTRVMMMPIVLGKIDSLPAHLEQYKPALRDLFEKCKQHHGQIGYLTIDEKDLKAGETHRRAGKHVDGVHEGSCGGWGGGGGGWGSKGNGMLTVSNVPGCRAWNQTFDGEIGQDGECDKLAAQCEEGTLFQANTVYWVDGLCVHESVPMERDTQRTFLRLSMPSRAPWFEGYTENPLGIKPTGPILPPRKYMAA